MAAVRVLGRADRGLAAALVDADPVVHSFVASRLDAGVLEPLGKREGIVVGRVVAGGHGVRPQHDHGDVVLLEEGRTLRGLAAADDHDAHVARGRE